MAFNFGGGKKEEDKSSEKGKDPAAFDALLQSMKGSKKEKVDLRNPVNREAYYRSLSQTDLIKYAKELDDIVDLFLASFSIMISDKSLDNGKAISKMLIHQAGNRLKVLRKD